MSMAAASRLELLANRCAVYIEELREFFLSRKIPCGNPMAIADLADRLDDPSFREEMTSMVRSVLYREDTPLSRSELLELLAISAGGANYEDAGLDLHEPFRRLMAFANEVLSAQRRGFSAREPASAEALTVDSALAANHTPAEYPLYAAARNSVDPGIEIPWDGTPAPGHAGSQEEPAPSATDAPPGDIEPIPTSVDEPSLLAGESAFSIPAPASTESTLPPPQSAFFAPFRRLQTLLQRNYWLPGLILLVAVAGAALWLLQPKPPGSAPVQQSSMAAPTRPVPTANAGRSRGRTLIPRPSPGRVPQSSYSSRLPEYPAPPGTPQSPAHTFSREPAFPAAPRPQAAPRTVPARSPTVDAREGVFLSSSGIMASHLLFAPAPLYPKLADFAHVEGQVIVQVVVGRSGKVVATRVLEGPLLLRGAAEHAIRRWRYKPYSLDGKTTDVSTIVTVGFQRRHR